MRTDLEPFLNTLWPYSIPVSGILFLHLILGHYEIEYKEYFVLSCMR